MNGKQYLAVIGDIIGSRNVDDRAGLQRQLGAGLADVNRRYANQIASKYLLTIGDEFQGLLRTSEDIDRILASLRVAVHPVDLRFGIGVGQLVTPIQEQAIGMDGPCFQRARAAIERAKERSTQIEVECGEAHPGFEIYSQLYSGMRRSWTERQRQIIDLSMSGKDGVDIARLLEISPPAVSQHLSAAGVTYVRNATAIWLLTLVLAVNTDTFGKEVSSA
jgi:DNA-binding CsgD family transcriptional regulator